MNPLIGPLLYCIVVFSGCVLYFHYNCADRRYSKASESAHEGSLSEMKIETKAML